MDVDHDRAPCARLAPARRRAGVAALAAHEVRRLSRDLRRGAGLAAAPAATPAGRVRARRLPSPARCGCIRSTRSTACSIPKRRTATTRRSTSSRATSRTDCSGCSSRRNSACCRTAPIYLAAIAGAWIVLRDRDTRFLGGVLLLTIAAFVAQHGAAVHVLGRIERTGAFSRAAPAVPRTARCAGVQARAERGRPRAPRHVAGDQPRGGALRRRASRSVDALQRSA